MPVRILIFLLLLSASVSAQKKVSEICATRKMEGDSIMRSYYGEYLFENYFEFDSSSSVIVFNNHRYWWGDTIAADSNFIYILRYRFVYPGSYDRYYYNIYVLSNDPTLDKSWGTSAAAYPGRCEIQDSLKLNSLALKELRHPLNKCKVQLLDVSKVGRSTSQPLDSSHIYLLVEHTKSKSPFYNKSMVKIRIHSIVVDGCTGQIISRNKRRHKVFMHF